MDARGLVLLVEDNAELNANNVRALHLLGYAVYPALTLAEARAWLGKSEPDIILLDVVLPDGDGIDFCAEIRGLPIQTEAHILFLSAKAEQADRLRGFANGGDDYIAKPFHPEELLARVEAATRRRHMNSLNSPMKTHTECFSDIIELEKLHAFAIHYSLTEKERTVLSYIPHRLSTKEMAMCMGITGKGVEFHITNILYKTGIKKRRDVLRVFADWKKENNQ